MSSPIYALQCAVCHVHHCAGHGQLLSIENRRSFYGHSMAPTKLGRVWASALSVSVGRRYPWRNVWRRWHTE